MWWEDPDFASKSTGMSGFVNFTDNLPLGCPYGKFCQQRLRVWIFPDFYYSPRIFAAWQLHACPWIFGDLCIHPDFASRSTGMSGFVNFTDNLPLGCPYGKFCQQRLRVWIFPDIYYSPRIFAAWQLHACPWIFREFVHTSGFSLP